MDVMETIQVFLSICGGISVVGGAIFMVWKFIKPAAEFSRRVEKLEKREDAMKETIDDVAAMQKEIIRIQLSILNHEITGNGVDEMKKIRDELTELIVK